MRLLGVSLLLALGCGAPQRPTTSIDVALLLGKWTGDLIVTKDAAETRDPGFTLEFRGDDVILIGDPPKTGRYWLRGSTIAFRGPGDGADFELQDVKLTRDTLEARAAIPAIGDLFPPSRVALRRAR